MKMDSTMLFCVGLLFAVIITCLEQGGFLFLGLGFFLFAKKRTLKTIICIALGIVIGYSSVLQKQNNIQSEFQPVDVEVSGYVQTQEVRSSYQQRITLIVEEAEAFLIGQTLHISLPRYPAVNKGDTVSVSCRLEYPEPFDGFAYDKYLASQSIFFICREGNRVSFGQTVFKWKRLLEYPRIAIAQKIESLWPRPQSSLVLGLLLGTRESFPQITLSEFQRSGVTHIIALSGFNITILIVFLESIAIRLLIPKRTRLWLIISGIIFFTVFVGAGASIVRAAIMGSLVLVGKYASRSISPLRLMLLTATVMTITNPFILLYDLGFQLSFLSTFGLLYLTTFFERCFFWVPSVFSLRESLATTLAATTTTLPLILLQFEQLSVVSPIANMLILPIIPWLMALGAVTVLISWLIPFLSAPFVWFVDLGCQYILSMSKYMASFSWSSLPVQLSFSAMVCSYVFIVFLILYERKKTA